MLSHEENGLASVIHKLALEPQGAQGKENQS
jgi:hypothetical protein